MRILSWLVLTLAVGTLACSSSTTTSASAEGEQQGKGTVLEIDGLRGEVPAEWKEEAPANRMRYAQFTLPRAEGDKEDAELVIFKGFGGSAKANIDRWIKTFEAPEGKDIEDVAKVTEMKIADRDASYLDIQGTYLFKAQPFNPNAKTERKPSYRMLAVHFEGKKDPYHIRLVGPAKTVEKHKKGFDSWLQGLK